jgi:DNA repair protein RecN (Recombination protein N)
MLRFLSVRHLAVIEQLEVEFAPGLNVLTGETGAGKSILVDAIDLLVGGRASADLVRTGEPHATVQAVFEAPGGREVLIRREISAEGRSRAFIDDALATAGALREQGAGLLSLHGQHENRALTDPAEQIDALDAFGGHQASVDRTAGDFDDWRAAADACDRSRLTDREKRARIEMASFQLQEIETVNPVAEEDETLTAEKDVLANADRLSRLSSEAFAALYESEHAALSSLATVWKRVADLAALDARAQPYVDRRENLKAELEDLAYFLRDYRERIDSAPDRLQQVEDRLAAIERLKHRYGPSLDAVLARRASLRDELDALGASEDRVAELTARERAARERFLSSARALSQARVQAAGTLSRALEQDLRELAMTASRFEIRVTPLADMDRATRRGIDDVEFLFSPNPGEDVRPLARIASGGEMSRVMLALRLQTLAGREALTLIFDEVDAGIGGTAADAVASRLQALGRNHQVLCVTHLAQVAARASAHFEIAKRVAGGRTMTSIRKLTTSEREQELARMIAGASISASVLASAREMLARGSSSEGRVLSRPGSEDPGLHSDSGVRLETRVFRPGGSSEQTAKRGRRRGA